MLIKPGIAVSEMSGKFGGFVASHNRAGQYFRQWRVPTDPATQRQQNVRNAMSAPVLAWGALSVAERAFWDSYAANTPRTTTLGEGTYLTGFQQFIRSFSVYSLILGYEPGFSWDGTVDSAGGLPGTVGILPATTIGVAAGLSLAYDDTVPWPLEDGRSAIFSMSAPRPITQKFDGGPRRIIGVVVGDVGGPPPASPYVVAAASLPFPLVAGTRTTLYGRVFHDDGRLSAENPQEEIIL